MMFRQVTLDTVEVVLVLNETLTKVDESEGAGEGGRKGQVTGSNFKSLDPTLYVGQLKLSQAADSFE